MKYDVLSVAANHGSVYALSWLSGQTFELWRAVVSTNSWQRLTTPPLYAAAGGSNMEGALIFKGASGWLMLGNDRGAALLATGTEKLLPTLSHGAVHLTHRFIDVRLRRRPENNGDFGTDHLYQRGPDMARIRYVTDRC
jgi:hypothetical protein